MNLEQFDVIVKNWLKLAQGKFSYWGVLLSLRVSQTEELAFLVIDIKNSELVLLNSF